MRPPRRKMLLGAGAAFVGVVGARFALPFWARAPRARPTSELSPRAWDVVAASFVDVDRQLLWDVHTHVVGLGMGDTGCFVGDDMQDHLHPIRRLKFDMYLASAGIRHREQTDAEFVARLRELARLANPDGKYLLMAFDLYVTPEGKEVPEKSEFFVPNSYVAQLASNDPIFGFIASVHPYRKDAVERLREAKKKGALAVKWLPNAMGIDPSSARCDASYEAMRDLGLALVTHTGVEQAVHAEEAQALGNPLLLRRALDHGVSVVAAHCASLGESVDLDAKSKTKVPSIDLFLRLLNEEKYRTLLYGDLSAITLQNRDPSALVKLLTTRECHERLLNGSDYPVIAVDPVISLYRLSMQGLLAEEDVEPLREIFSANPLLFDYVLKRRLRVIRGKDAERFSPRAFETRRVFEHLFMSQGN